MWVEAALRPRWLRRGVPHRESHAPPLINRLSVGAFMVRWKPSTTSSSVWSERWRKRARDEVAKFASPLDSLAMRVGNNVWGGEQFAKDAGDGGRRHVAIRVLRLKNGGIQWVNR